MAPNKLRQIIVTRVNAGESKSDVARALNISRNTIYKAMKAYEKHGTTDYIAKPGRPIAKDKEDFIEAVRAEIDLNLNQSIKNLARTFNKPEATMRKLVKMDLGIKSLAVVQVQ